jgi:aquaporin TIP
MRKFELSAEFLGLSGEDLGPRLWKSAIAEGIAVLLFVFIGAGAVVVSTQDELTLNAVIIIALAHGLAFATLVAMTAGISGGHINPAVTFAIAITGRMKLGPGVVYIGAQLIGAVLGALLLQVVLAGEAEGVLGAHGGPSSAVDGVSAAVVIEAVFTFVLVFTVFATAVDTKKGLGHVAPLFIGLAILIGHLMGVPLTGASMNPARSFGPALVAGEWLGNWRDWLAIYVGGPAIGASLAGVVYMLAFWDRDDDA